MEQSTIGLEGFRLIGSFIVGCKRLIKCVDYVDGVEKRMTRETARGENDGWWRKTPQKSLI